MIHARIDSMLRVPRGQLDDDQIETIRAALTIPNPKHAAALKAGRSTRRIPSELCGLEGDLVNEELLLPRGATDILRSLGPVTWNDQRVKREPALPYKVRGTLRPYQVPAVNALVRNQQGILVAPCGSGKTTLGCAIIAQCQQPALVVVGSLDLVEQWHCRVSDTLGVTTSQYAGGKRDVGPVTIATMQSLAGRIQDVEQYFGTLMVDECHHLPCEQLSGIISQVPARYRFGLTATPKREDGLTDIIHWHLGKILHTIQAAELVAEGHLVQPNYVRVFTDFKADYYGPEDYAKVLEALLEDEPRNHRIVTAVTEECTQGALGLLLTGRIAHAELLYTLIQARAPHLRAAILTGDTPRKRRAEVLSQAREGSLDMLIATQLADEGLDLPRLDRVFLTFPSKAEGKTIQRIGRAMRPHPGKRTPKVLDVVDPAVGVLMNQARKRQAAFNALWNGGVS